jgi:glutaredoxin
MFFVRPFVAAGLLGLLAAAGTAVSDANAQQIYRIVGPDGRVTFSDQPPLDPAANAKPANTVSLPGGAGSGNGNLPFELREVSTRYPVTLYTAADCGPCGAGRAMLASRGIPFTEKTVSTNEDLDSLKRLIGGTTIPTLTVGGQQLKGFSETEWAQYLDAAGYPKTSQLPPNYSRPAPSPLVAAQQVQPPARPAQPQPQAQAEPQPAAPQPGEPTPDNPRGITF